MWARSSMRKAPDSTWAAMLASSASATADRLSGPGGGQRGMSDLGLLCTQGVLSKPSYILQSLNFIKFQPHMIFNWVNASSNEEKMETKSTFDEINGNPKKREERGEKGNRFEYSFGNKESQRCGKKKCVWGRARPKASRAWRTLRCGEDVRVWASANNRPGNLCGRAGGQG